MRGRGSRSSPFSPHLGLADALAVEIVLILLNVDGAAQRDFAAVNLLEENQGQAVSPPAEDGQAEVAGRTGMRLLSLLNTTST